MNRIRRLLTAASLLAVGVYLLNPSRAWPETPLVQREPAVFFVIENGGTVQNREEMIKNINYLFGEATKWRRKRDTKGTIINVILTTNPTEVTWSGTPEQLYLQGHEVMELIQFKPTCSDLRLAWKEVEQATRSAMPVSLQLIGVGPMIHAGFPCDEGETTIHLPQAVPDGLALGDLAMQADRLLLVGVHADQDEVYLDYLEHTGVLARVRAGKMRFDLLDNARARASRGSMLEDR